MTVGSYGEHAENAARALNTLIRDDLIPAEPAAVDQLLHCREVVVDALRQRLYDMGQDNWSPPANHLPGRTPQPTLADVDGHLATLVDNIAFAMPALALDERRPPIEVLGRDSDDPTVESWREAAIELLAASHALAAAEDQPWRRDPGAGWWMMRDMAVALEAVLVLDARLDEAGLLVGLGRPEFAMGLEEKRLILSQTARVATWHATSAAPDQAAPPGPRPVTTVVQPVALVSAPDDLAAAQQRLVQLLRTQMSADATSADPPEISADSARQITAGQLHLCRSFAKAAGRSPKTVMLVPFFEERAQVLEALQPQISHLVDVTAREPNPRRFWQQSELTSAVTRMDDQGVRIRLQPTQMVELAKATHEVTHQLGAALRRELLRGGSNLRDANPTHQAGPLRVGRWSPLDTTLTDLVDLPAPSEPAARYSNPLQRAALKQTLDITPTSPRPPTPFPAARTTTNQAPVF